MLLKSSFLKKISNLLYNSCNTVMLPAIVKQKQGTTMKKMYLSAVICLLTFSIVLVGQNEPIAEKENTQVTQQIVLQKDNESYQRILLTFSQMVTNFFKIATDPKNPQNVGLNLTQMLAGLVNIGMEIFRTNPLEPDNEICIELTEEDLAIIESIKEKFVQLTINLANTDGV